MLRSKLTATLLATCGIAAIEADAHAVIPYDTEITPGELRGIAHAPGDPWIYGYWEYLPSNFDTLPTGDPGYPLLVFLPGVGEYDDVSSCPGGTDLCTPSDCGSDGLCRNLTWGPQELMQDGAWDEVLRPFIMVSPQHPVPPGSAIEWNMSDLDAYIQFVVDNYPVDQRRLYLIGMSQGGRAVLQYTTNFPRRFTAVAPTPGGSVSPIDASCYFQDTALWVFHGENDADGTLGPGVFAPCTMVDLAYRYDHPDLYAGTSAQCASIVGQPRPDGRLTVYDNVGHFAWRQTVDPIGLGFPNSEWTSDQGCFIPADFREYSAALDSDGVYSWFLSLDRPRALAPNDVVGHDAPDLSLHASVVDDDTFTVEWTQTGGPAVTLTDTDALTLQVSDLAELETYTFEVYVVDADGQWDRDEVEVTTDVFPIPATGSGDTGAATSSGGIGETDGATGTSSGGATGSTSSGGMTTAATSGDTGGSTSTGGDSSSGSVSDTAATSDTGATSSVTSGATSDSDDTGPSATTNGPSTTGDDTTGAGPTSGASASGPSATTSAGSGSVSDSGGDASDTEGAIDEVITDGCSCRSGDRGGAPAALWWMLGALWLRRRRD